MTLQQILFIVVSLVVLGAAVLVVTTRNLFHAALFLVVSFFGVAAFYVLLDAGFFAAAQVLVYIGAISILFIFAVMLTRDVITAQRGNSQWQAAAIVSGVLFMIMAVLLGPLSVTIRGRQFGSANWPFDKAGDVIKAAPSNFVGTLGSGLVDFNQYGVPFLLAAVLLLVAMVGAIWVAREMGGREAVSAAAAETAIEDADADSNQPVQEPLPLPETADADVHNAAVVEKH
jgi:NADH-quinone oxidoreductase subunit J